MKIKALAVTAGILAISSVIGYAEENTIGVYVDNNKVTFDQAPYILDGRTMVPIRAVFEKAGADVSWDSDTRTATIKKDTFTVTTTVGDPFILKNGKPIAIDVPTTITNDRLAIPVRAISEAMDFGVVWNQINNDVLISTTGKDYRMNARWETGFLPLEDAGFLSTTELYDIPYFDLDGDGTTDALAFIPSKTNEDGTKNTPALWVAGQNFNSVLESDQEPYAIAVVDIVDSDKYKEIIVLYNGEDGKSAGIYRYNGNDVFHIKANMANSNGMIPYQNKIFVDGKENIIADTYGLCFTNIMLCSGMYSLENGELKRYISPQTDSIGYTFSKKYNDNQPLSFMEVKLYSKGDYVDSVRKNDVISSDTLTEFKILDYYIDDIDPSKFEFFIELPNGKTAVIWPYQE